MSTVEKIAPSVCINGQTVQPPGWMWILGFAMAGCQWAIDEMDKPEVKQQIESWRNARKEYQLDESIRWVEEQLNQLNTQLSDLKLQKTLLRVDIKSE